MVTMVGFVGEKNNLFLNILTSMFYLVLYLKNLIHKLLYNLDPKLTSFYTKLNSTKVHKEATMNI